MRKQFLKLLLGIAIGVAFLAILFHHLDVSRVWSEIEDINKEWFMVSVICVAISFFIRGERWRQILKPLNPNVPVIASWRIFIIGIAGNVLLPFRLGDVFRGTIFSKRLGVPVGGLMTSILIEKMCDLVFIVLLGGIALIIVPEAGHSEVFHLGGTMILAVGIFAIAFLFCARWFRKPAIFLIEKILRPLPKFSEKLLPVASHVFDALDMVARPAVISKVMFLSALTWIFEWLTFICVAFGMTSLSKPLGSFLAMPIATLSTALPGAPGGVGTFDFFAEEAMKLLGNARDASTAYAFLVHAIILMSPVLLALLALPAQDWKILENSKGR